MKKNRYMLHLLKSSLLIYMYMCGVHGLQKTYCADKKDIAPYSEKVVNLKFQPSMSQFGGKPVDGLIIITATETVSY